MGSGASKRWAGCVDVDGELRTGLGSGEGLGVAAAAAEVDGVVFDGCAAPPQDANDNITRAPIAAVNARYGPGRAQDTIRARVISGKVDQVQGKLSPAPA